MNKVPGKCLSVCVCVRVCVLVAGMLYELRSLILARIRVA